MYCSRPRATHSTVIARLAAYAKAPARQHSQASAKPWRSRDRAIQYAAASPSYRAASGILDPRFRGDDNGGRFSLSDANELEQGG
jgi:hypothetical protein